MDFGSIPAAYETQKTIIVYNKSNNAACWKLTHNQSRLFHSDIKFSPAHGLLQANESVEVQLSLYAYGNGDFSDVVELQHEDGTQQIRIVAFVNELSIQLQRDKITLPATYINLKSQATVTLHNVSDLPVEFRLKIKDLAEINQRTPVKRPSLKDVLFRHKNWNIWPIQGELFPHASKEFTITFLPVEAMTHSCITLFECNGQNNCIPLQLVGEGIGPKALLSVDILDAGVIFVGAIHHYNVSLHNVGEIPGVFNLTCDDTVAQNHKVKLDVNGITYMTR